MNRFDAVPPVSPPIPRPRWRGDVINRTLGRAMTITAATGALAGLVCVGLAIGAGWGELWGWLVPYMAAGFALLSVPFLAAGLLANRYSARKFGRAASVASTDITMVIPSVFYLVFGPVYIVACALGPGLGRAF